VWKERNEIWLQNNKTELLEKYGLDKFQNTFNSGDCGVTASGVQYEIFHRGFGQIPKRASDVSLKSTGWLIDGTRIQTSDGTYFTVSSGLVAGWQEVICQMPQNSHFKIYIPYELGYGKDGDKASPFLIPPYSTLIYDVEIIDVAQSEPSNN
jgi:FKBP-type peptidyl-prolyl cis-trans isomerase FklB